MCSVLCFVKKKHIIDVQKFVLKLKVSAVVHIPPAFTFTLNKFGRVGATKFCRANAPKKLLLDFTQHSKPTYFFCLHFHGEPIFDIYSQKDETFYASYETLLHIFTSNSVRQVLPKFLPLNCGRKITDFKEWSKIRVCSFF